MNYTLVKDHIIVNDFNIIIFFIFLVFSLNILYLKFKTCFSRNNIIKYNNNSFIDTSYNIFNENLIIVIKEIWAT